LHPCLTASLATALAVTGVSIARAGQPDAADYLTDVDFLQDVPVINSVAHLPQKRSDAPVAVTIIDQRMIRASGATSPVEVLRLVPGFQAYYVNGNRFGAGYHGMGGEYPRSTEVKIDGRPVYDSLLNAVEWQSLGLELRDIEYIEVVRGPNQAADGANAFLGTINIVTRSPVANEGTSVRALAGYGDAREASAVHNVTLGDIHNRLTASYKTNDGFPDTEEYQLNDDLRLGHIGYRGVWTPNLIDELDLQLGYSTSENGLGGDGTAGQPDDVLQRDYQYAYQSLSWQRNLNQLHSFETIFYHNDLSAADEPIPLGLVSGALGVPPAVIPFLFPGFSDFELPPIELEARSQRFDLEFRHILDFSPSFRMNWGAAVRYDRATSEHLFDTQGWVSETSYRLFTNMEGRPTDWLTLNLGLMGEHSEFSGSFLSPRFSSNFHLDKHNTLRLMASRGYRPPSLLEANQMQAYRKAEVLGLPPDIQVYADPGIGKEVVTNYEFGYLGEFRRLGLSVDIKFFVEELQMLIGEVLVTDTTDDVINGAVMRTNSTDIDTRGFELGLDYRPTEQLLIAGQLSHITLDGERLRRLPSGETRDASQSTPEYSMNLLASYTFAGDIEVGVNYFRQHYVKWSQGDAIEPFNRVDLRLAKTFQFGQTSTLLEFIVQNTLNQDYLEYHDWNTFERRSYVRFSVDW
jgi:iron complex outermembrane receptor protein